MTCTSDGCVLSIQGSVFAEFKTIEDAKKFVAMDPKPTFQDEVVVAMTKWVLLSLDFL